MSKTDTPNYAHVKIPCEFITPYTYTAKDGREFDKAYVSIPKGTTLNGIDISSYTCSVFMNDHMKQQQLDGDRVTLSFKDNSPVTIWTGKQGSEQHPYKKFEVKPWDLIKAVAQQLHDYREQKTQERTSKQPSLSDTAHNSRHNSDSLAGKETVEQRNER